LGQRRHPIGDGEGFGNPFRAFRIAVRRATGTDQEGEQHYSIIEAAPPDGEETHGGLQGMSAAQSTRSQAATIRAIFCQSRRACSAPPPHQYQSSR
jgi:hypothetical protein